MAQLMTKSEFAAYRSVAKSRVSHWIRDGLIDGAALVGSGRAAKINADLATAQLAARREPGQTLGNGARARLAPVSPRAPDAARPEATRVAPPARSTLAAAHETYAAQPYFMAVSDDADPESLDYQLQRARLAKAQADAQERKNAEAAGELIPVSEMKEGWAVPVAAFRSRMLAVPKRARDAIPTLTSADVAKLDAEVREALTELGRATFLA